MKTIQLAIATCAGLILAASPSSAHPTATTDAQGVERAMKAQFDKPGAPLTVAPVSVEGKYAVAGWIQDGRGGRALLRKDHGKWSIQVCGGDGLKTASSLAMTGMDHSSASKLAHKVEAAEKKLPTDQVRKLSMFVGIVEVEGGGHTPHHSNHAK